MSNKNARKRSCSILALLLLLLLLLLNSKMCWIWRKSFVVGTKCCVFFVVFLVKKFLYRILFMCVWLSVCPLVRKFFCYVWLQRGRGRESESSVDISTIVCDVDGFHCLTIFCNQNGMARRRRSRRTFQTILPNSLSMSCAHWLVGCLGCVVPTRIVIVVAVMHVSIQAFVCPSNRPSIHPSSHVLKDV